MTTLKPQDKLFQELGQDNQTFHIRVLPGFHKKIKQQLRLLIIWLCFLFELTATFLSEDLELPGGGEKRR